MLEIQATHTKCWWNAAGQAASIGRGSFKDPDLELHADFGSLWEWDLLSGPHNWPFFDMPSLGPRRLAHLQSAGFSWLWRPADSRGIVWLSPAPTPHTSLLMTLLLWAVSKRVMNQHTGGRLKTWLSDKLLSLNVIKSKELIVDFRRGKPEVHEPVIIEEVERVSNFKFLDVTISEDLSWTHHGNIIAKKTRQRLYFLRSLWRFSMSLKTLANLYRRIVESVLTGCITAWYGNTNAFEWEILQKVVYLAQCIICKTTEHIYMKGCHKKSSIHHQRASPPRPCSFLTAAIR
ncbi:uncharacterized protein LOC134340602 [Mobula hypostoma]|uniref:uncharacterized protein LOC134340602 n=1 Tax=Mobula hypostoma TaxID=723540 RepID=UPI002FC31076